MHFPNSAFFVATIFLVPDWQSKPYRGTAREGSLTISWRQTMAVLKKGQIIAVNNN